MVNNPTPVIYLNNAATTYPKPPEVLEEGASSLRLPVHEAGRTTGTGSTDYPSAACEALAAFFHAGPPEHVIFTQNATDALNLLIHGFVMHTGAPFHAITTELDHNSVLRPLTTLEQDGAITPSRSYHSTMPPLILGQLKKRYGPRPGSW